jgi:flagellar biosynthetic protein FliR
MVGFDESLIAQWLSPILWPFLRVLAIFSVAPVFSSKAFPVRARIGFAFFIALAVQASLPEGPVISVNDKDAAGVAAQQVLVGLSIGFAVRLIFASMELAGEVIGFQMGLNFAAFFDPSMNTQSSAMGRFFSQISLLLFVATNAHFVLIVAFVKSFQVFPVTQNLLISLAHLELYLLGASIFSSALWIAMPVVGMLLFVNLALGIISRVAPQMNIFAVGFPITLVVGILGVALTLPMLEHPFEALLTTMLAKF